MAVVNSGFAVAVRGLKAKPAMVAAGSWRPSRSKRAARMARGEQGRPDQPLRRGD